MVRVKAGTQLSTVAEDDATDTSEAEDKDNMVTLLVNLQKQNADTNSQAT